MAARISERTSSGTDAKRFSDRREAGRELARALRGHLDEGTVVFALPRGGVPVGFEVSQALGLPLEPMLVRKIGAPRNAELAVGAIGPDGQVILDAEAIETLGCSRDELSATIRHEQAELSRRRRLYLGDRGELDLHDRTVVLVDDGVATGSTAVAAGRALRSRGAGRVVLAIPVGPRGTERELADEFDEIVCLRQPRLFGSVGTWYRDFEPTSDREVLALLGTAWHSVEGAGAAT